VGEVVRTDIDYHDIDNLLEPDSRIPVLIDIVPARLGYEDDYSVLDDVDERVNELIDDGLTAGLAMGNLLTGQKYIELQYYGNGFGETETFAGYTVIPSIDGQLDQLMTNASNAMQTINQLPLAELVDSADLAMDEIAGTLAEFRKSASDLDEILSDPAAHELMGTLNAALTSFQELAADFSEGSATNIELQKSLQSLARALNELEPVLRNIRRNPNSLIFGVSEDPDVEPKGERE
jgi:paraquat-inducible protein B